MAIEYRFAGSANSKTAGTTLAVNVNNGNTPAAGDLMVVCFAMDDDGASPGSASCADNKGNTFSKDVDRSQGGSATGSRVIIFSSILTTGYETGGTVTITHPNVTARAACFMGFSGIASSNRVDQTNSGVGTNSTPNSGSVTTTQANELLIGAAAVEDQPNGVGTNFYAFTPTTNFTEGSGGLGVGATGTLGGGDASNMSVCAEYRIVSSTVTVNTSTTNEASASRDWAAAIVTYKAALALPPAKSLRVNQAVKRGSFF